METNLEDKEDAVEEVGIQSINSQVGGHPIRDIVVKPDSDYYLE